MSKDQRVFSAFSTIVSLLTNETNGHVMGRKELSIIEEAIRELSSIQEADPSEALKCLEKLNSFDVVVGKTKKYDISTTVGNYFRCEITTIKQSLLKAQEFNEILKKYNVEDLEELNTILSNYRKHWC